MHPDVDRLAKIIWDYHHVHQPLKKCDVIFVLCSLDTRVAEYAVKLFRQGYGRYIIFSGGLGKLTTGRFARSEAAEFAHIAQQLGVSAADIITEDRSTNTGENVRFTYEVLQQRGLDPRSFLLVQKPYMERRTYATFKKQWPDPTAQCTVTSPPIAYEQYFTEQLPKDLVIGVMVGDVVRIKEYPARGFQIPQPIPTAVWRAARQLIALGYDQHI